VNGQPTLRSLLLGIHWVFSRRMQYRNTNFAIGPNVGVKYWGDETHDGRIIWIRMRELKGCLKYAALIKGAFRAHNAHRPIKKIIAVQTSGETIVSVPGA
jgi:hypothetical protein